MDSDSRILVAGANGMVGSAIVRNLRKQGYFNIIEATRNTVDFTDQEETKEFIEIKNFRIYKWSKPVKDFLIPKGFRMAEFQEFVDLYDSDLIKLESYGHYFVRHFSKKQQKKEYCLSRLYLDGDLILNSNFVSLAGSDGDGRVVLIKEKLK